MNQSKPLLKITDVTKRYGDVTAVANMNLEVNEGEIVCLLGPSGCGKTTLLRLVAGLEQADVGSIELLGTDLGSIPVHERGFGFMFQDYALFPHMTVEQNVGFGLRMTGKDNERNKERVTEMLNLVGLTGKEDRSTAELSGGEQQRVALARSLAPNPPLLLLDEPLGSLDRTLRERLMNELRAILKTVGVTAITVTHDQQEAFALADRIVIMMDGKAIQEGVPSDVYGNPATPKIAQFLGLTNLIKGAVNAKDRMLIDTPIGEFVTHGASMHSPGVCVLVRPEAATLEPVDGYYRIDGSITSCSFRGRHSLIRLQHRSGENLSFVLRTLADQIPATGAEVSLYLDPKAISFIST